VLICCNHPKIWLNGRGPVLWRSFSTSNKIVFFLDYIHSFILYWTPELWLFESHTWLTNRSSPQCLSLNTIAWGTFFRRSSDVLVQLFSFKFIYSLDNAFFMHSNNSWLFWLWPHTGSNAPRIHRGEEEKFVLSTMLVSETSWISCP